MAKAWTPQNQWDCLCETSCPLIHSYLTVKIQILQTKKSLLFFFALANNGRVQAA